MWKKSLNHPYNVALAAQTTNQMKMDMESKCVYDCTFLPWWEIEKTDNKHIISRPLLSSLMTLCLNYKGRLRTKENDIFLSKTFLYA